MSSKTLISHSISKTATALFGLMLLGACEEGAGFQLPTFGETSENSVATLGGPEVSLVERDVEAPDVFSVDEAGLWDGRPSLGGVWVAHPSAVDPERVIIRNPSNGNFVIGALFRRERENPGPALQVSSDAAAELGVLAGSPTQLSVVALRREEAPLVGETIETAPLSTPVDVTAAPLDSPENNPTDTVAAIEDDAANALPEPAAEATETNALTGAAAIAIAAAEAAAANENATEVAASDPVATAVASPRSALEKPFIQIGIFSVEANANRTNELLKGDGLIGTVLAQSSNGRPFWRVIVGPAPTADDRADVLRKVKALGFEDAYFVTN